MTAPHVLDVGMELAADVRERIATDPKITEAYARVDEFKVALDAVIEAGMLIVEHYGLRDLGAGLVRAGAAGHCVCADMVPDSYDERCLGCGLPL